MTNYRGFKVTARNNHARSGEKQIVVKIDGHPFWSFTSSREDAIADACLYIDASIERPHAYTWTRELSAAQLSARVNS